MSAVLIAECCQNHNGDREVLRRMVHAAAEAGADYVKIQALRSDEITFRERFEEGKQSDDGKPLVIKRPYDAEVGRLSALDLSPDDEAWFVDECLRAGVMSMVTVFTRTGARRLADMGFDAIKIASYDCASYPLLQDVVDRWSTVFVSTGATLDDEVERAAAILRQAPAWGLLHCVTIYPTPIDQLHLRRMQWLRKYSPLVGWSDHTAPAVDGLWASKLALAFGADIIERHFTVLDPSETRDGPVSINPKQLMELREFADLPRIERMERITADVPGWERALGKGRHQLSAAELLNRDYYRGRVASKIGGLTVFNWEDVDLDGLISREPRTS